MSNNQQKPQQPAKGTLLIVDPEPETQAAITKVMSERGYGIVTAVDSKQAFLQLDMKFSRQAPCMMFVSVVMPGMSGFEFARRIREKYSTKQLPIFLVAKHRSTEDELELHNVGAQALVVKPITAEAINAIFEDLEMKKIKAELGEMVFNINYE
ncbi:MAG: response regulator [Oligoflexia bacterium]|nr:response regulator [Oligoflexia bacterium]